MKRIPTHAGLTQWFRLLVAAASAGGAVAAGVGCGATSPEGAPSTDAGVQTDASVLGDASLPFESRIPTDAGTKALCPTAGASLLAQVTPATPVDYVIIRSLANIGTPDVRSMYNQDSAGSPCSKATNKPACEATLATKLLDSASGWDVSIGGGVQTNRALIFTRNDIVGTVASLDELRAFVAPVDTLADAAFLASEVLRKKFNCDTDRVEAFPDGGHEVTFYEVTRDCDTSPTTMKDVDYIESTETKVRVNADGSVGAPQVKVLNRVETPTVACPVIGRRVEGFFAPTSDSDNPLGRFFADIASLEAAAVPAFDRLARELLVHGAPEALIAAARRSEADEVRHAKTMGALARRFGATPNSATDMDLPVRSLLEMAMENAVEGCVRETFGGLMATYQSEHAKDEAVARVFKAIAHEETGHGALAWQVAAWIETKLTSEEQALVRQARHRALSDLLVELETEPGDEVARAAGLPSAAVATSLCRAMATGLFQHAA